MEKYILKSALVAEIERRINEINLDIIEDWRYRLQREHDIEVMKNILSFINTLEVKEIADEETKWSPNKKQIESLKDMLKYNIGVFDYQKFMEVNSLYDDLKKLMEG